LISNDRTYMGENTNGWMLNTVATIYLILLGVLAVATVRLMIITKGGA